MAVVLQREGPRPQGADPTSGVLQKGRDVGKRGEVVACAWSAICLAERNTAEVQ